MTLTVFQLLLANAGWVEGTQDGTVGSGGASSKFLINQNTNNASTIGTGTVGFTSTGAFSSTVAGAAGGDLNLWVGTPTLTGSNDFFRIASRKTAGTASDPLLTVNYTLVPEPSAAFLGGLGMLALLRRRNA